MLRSIFWLLLVIVAAVAAYDVYLSIKFQDVLFAMEENPIGRWLIALDEGDVALFMTAKMIGVTAVVLTLPAIYRFRRSWGLLTVTALASFQSWLFYYLTFA